MNEQAQFCAACGSPVPTGATFCPRCGTTVPGGAAAPFVAAPGVTPGAGHATGVQYAPGYPPGYGPGPRVGGMQGVPPAWAAGAEIAPPGLRALSWLVEMGAVTAITVLGALVLDRGGSVLWFWRTFGYDRGSLLATQLPQFLVLVWFVVAWIWEGRTGRRLGNVVTGTRTVDAATGQAPGVGRVFLSRLVLGAISFPVTLVSSVVTLLFLFGLVATIGTSLLNAAVVMAVAATGALDKGPLRQGWHEKASGTTVVRARSGSARPAAAPPALPVAAPMPQPVQQPMQAPAVAPIPAPIPAPVAAAPRPAPIAAPPAQGLIADVPGFAPSPAGQAYAAPVAATPAPPAAPTAPADEDDLVHTRLSPRASHRGGHRLAFDTGEVVHVTGRGIVGRAPEAAAGEEVEHLVAITDPDMSVSKTHLAFGTDATGLWVEDKGSTNGTELLVPGVEPEPVPAGRRVVVPDGATVRFGERSFVVRLS